MTLLKYHFLWLNELAKSLPGKSRLSVGLVAFGFVMAGFVMLWDSQNRIGFLNLSALHLIQRPHNLPIMTAWALCLVIALLAWGAMDQRRNAVLLCRLRPERQSVRTRGRGA
jgi:hypothetical protein